MFAIVTLPALFAFALTRERPSIAVAPVILHNMSASANTREDSSAIQLLTREARARLVSCGFPVVGDSATALEREHEGATYLFEHADVVAQWGAAQRADWVLLSRLNRIGPWIAEWEVQVVSTKEQRVVDTRVVELKGLGRDTSLTAHMASRGAAWFIDQTMQSVFHASRDTTAGGRPCHA